MPIPTLSYQQALVDEIKDLPEEVLPNLLQIVHLFKESLELPRKKNHQEKTYEEKINLMKQAVNDPLFLADLKKVNEDFEAIDKATWEEF
jgi:hypothetical protein